MICPSARLIMALGNTACIAARPPLRSDRQMMLVSFKWHGVSGQQTRRMTALSPQSRSQNAWQLWQTGMLSGRMVAEHSEVEKESPSGGWLRHMRVWRTLVRVSSWRGLVVAGMQRIARTAIWRAHGGSFATAVASFRRGRSVHASIRRQPHIMLCAKANHSVAALTFSRPRTTNRVSP